jgi:hypothetical protein
MSSSPKIITENIRVKAPIEQLINGQHHRDSQPHNGQEYKKKAEPVFSAPLLFDCCRKSWEAMPGGWDGRRAVHDPPD